MKPLVAAHRGLSSEQPENTLAAFGAAVAAGFTCIEMDLRLTRDKEVVVLHDAGLERTTDGTGRVAEMGYDELRRYDTGAGPVPRLDDILRDLDGWRGLWMLEMKDPDATVPALELMAHHDLLDRTMVVAFRPRILRMAREHQGDVPRGLIVLGPPDEDDYGAATKEECAWISLDADFLDKETVTAAKDKGFQVAAWTVNDEYTARELGDVGTDCIVTDERSVLGAFLETL